MTQPQPPSPRKAGWPLTEEFARGMTQFARVVTEGVYELHQVAQKAMEAFIVTHEVMVISNAKIAFTHERGYRPSFWELYQWAKDTGRGNIAGFLYANRRNPHITGLFGTEQPSLEPPQED